MAQTITGQIKPPLSIKINLATPSHANAYCGEYVQSLYALLTLGHQKGMRFSLSTVNYSDIEYSRNYLISNFYFNKTDCSHLLFVDDDMGYPAQLIFDMLALGEDVVGVIAHKRQINLRKLHEASALPYPQALAQAMEFIQHADPAMQRRGAFRTVKACGAGILLISRACIDQMIAAMPDLVRTSDRPNLEKQLHLFDKIHDGDRILSEDFSFCTRWRAQCGGQVWAATHAPIKHVGKIAFETRFDDL